MIILLLTGKTATSPPEPVSTIAQYVRLTQKPLDSRDRL